VRRDRRQGRQDRPWRGQPHRAWSGPREPGRQDQQGRRWPGQPGHPCRGRRRGWEEQRQQGRGTGRHGQGQSRAAGPSGPRSTGRTGRSFSSFELRKSPCVARTFEPGKSGTLAAAGCACTPRPCTVLQFRCQRQTRLLRCHRFATIPAAALPDRNNKARPAVRRSGSAAKPGARSAARPHWGCARPRDRRTETRPCRANR
jgi:hypothetical protein